MRPIRRHDHRWVWIMDQPSETNLRAAVAGSSDVRPRPLLPPVALLVAALSASSALAGCGTVHAGAAATIGDTRITTDELARRTTAVYTGPVAQQLARPDVQRLVLGELVGLAVDERLATRDGVTVTQQQVDQLVARGVSQTGGLPQLQLALLTSNPSQPAFAGADTYFRDALLLDGLLKQRAPTTVPEQALRDLYRQQEGQFRNAHLAHIMLADQPTAQTVAVKAKAAPATFAALAEQYSTDTATKDKGGDQGTQPKGTFTAAVEDAVYAASPGAVLGPLAVNGGFEVVQVVSVVDRSFEAARAELEAAAKDPQSPYTQGLLSQARAAEAGSLHPYVNPRFGTVDLTRGFRVLAAPNLLSRPAGQGGTVGLPGTSPVAPGAPAGPAGPAGP